tara:strand:+ start:102 stop:338 length:237 start_codon:yes stop_codon:yes gene_type:complete
VKQKQKNNAIKREFAEGIADLQNAFNIISKEIAMTQNVISYFIKYMKKEDKFKKYLDKVNKELEEKNGEHKQSEHNGS